MAKDLIIGVCSNFNYNHIKPWVKSAKDCGFQGDVVLVTIDMAEEVNKQVEDDGVIVVRAKKQSNMLIHMERFYHIHKFLNEHKDYNWVISTDVRDVIFQRNPSEYVEFLPKQIVSSGEAILIKNEHWNRDNIIKNFGEYFYDEIKDREVQCVGVLAGNAYAMKDLAFYIYQMSLNRPDWVADQAAYNMIIHHAPWKQLTEFASLRHAWAINGHVTNYEPDMKRFEPYLLEPRPRLENGLVVNDAGEPFYIVHQYDRVVDWKKVVEQKYEVVIPSQYTPDAVDGVITINTGV